MREDNNITNQRDDNSVDIFGQRIDHTDDDSEQRIDHTDNNLKQRIDHDPENTVVQPDDNVVVSDTQPDDHEVNPSVHTNIKSEPVTQSETEDKGNTSSFPWKVMFVVVLIGFLIAVGILIKNKIETNPDKGTTVSVTAESSVSVLDETPFIDVTANESISLTENASEATEVISTAKTTEKFNSGELNNVINEIITTVKTTAKTVYTLTLDSNGGDDPNETRKISSGEASTLPFADKTYYITYNSNGGKMDVLRSEYIIDCLGWSKSKNDTSPDYSCGIPYYPTKNETLYAVWSSRVDVKITDEKPTRSGYNFLGWSTSQSASTATYRPNDFITISNDTTLYAVWQKISYTLAYNANGGSGAPSAQTGSSSYIISSTQPTRAGYKFLGWSKSSSASSASYTAGDSITLSSDTTLYAVWQKISYTLAYNANGGSGAPSAQTGSSSYIISSTQPTRVGYKFLGWSKSSSASSASYSTGNIITLSSDTTLYAIWEQISVKLGSYYGSSRVNIQRTGTKINNSTVGWPIPLPAVKSNVTGESGSGWEIVSGNLVIDGFTMYITQPGEVKVRYKLIYKGYSYYSEIYTYNLTLYKHTSDENFIRKSPGESSEKTGRYVPANYEIEIQKFQVDPNGCHLWGYVDYNGTKGWITCLVLS